MMLGIGFSCVLRVEAARCEVPFPGPADIARWSHCQGRDGPLALAVAGVRVPLRGRPAARVGAELASTFATWRFTVRGPRSKARAITALLSAAAMLASASHSRAFSNSPPAAAGATGSASAGSHRCAAAPIGAARRVRRRRAGRLNRSSPASQAAARPGAAPAPIRRWRARARRDRAQRSGGRIWPREPRQRVGQPQPSLDPVAVQADPLFMLECRSPHSAGHLGVAIKHGHVTRDHQQHRVRNPARGTLALGRQLGGDSALRRGVVADRREAEARERVQHPGRRAAAAVKPSPRRSRGASRRWPRRCRRAALARPVPRGRFARSGRPDCVAAGSWSTATAGLASRR
jgi:hypothetical protein